jgi:hypothetical protein
MFDRQKPMTLPEDASEEVIARRLLIIRGEPGSGADYKVEISIGRPTTKEDGEAHCNFWVLNERDNVSLHHALVGVDEIGALESAMRFVNTYLERLTPSGELCWADGEPYV